MSNKRPHYLRAKCYRYLEWQLQYSRVQFLTQTNMLGNPKSNELCSALKAMQMEIVYIYIHIDGMFQLLRDFLCIVRIWINEIIVNLLNQSAFYRWRNGSNEQMEKECGADFVKKHQYFVWTFSTWWLNWI